MDRMSVRANCLVSDSFSESSNSARTDSSPEFRPVELSIENGTIIAIRPLAPDEKHDESGLIVPGFIDIQFNGINTDDLWQVVRNSDHSAWHRIESSLLDQGVTAWCPTFISAPSSHYHQLASFISTIATASSADHINVDQPLTMPDRPSFVPRPSMLGLHLEGPFLGSALGAHSPDNIRPPDWGWLQFLSPYISVLTMGAEAEGAVELCRVAHDHGIVVALGHSAPSRDQFDALRNAGATLVTHLFNGMSGMHHRHPGLAAWALADDDLYCSLIADGVHVDPALIRIAFRSRPSHIVLVTDRVAHLHPHLRTHGGAAYRPDDTLAGSIVSMSEVLRICVNSAGISLPQAVMAATHHPARALGCTDRGRIAVGSRADLVALNDDVSVRAVWLAGRRVR